MSRDQSSLPILVVPPFGTFGRFDFKGLESTKRCTDDSQATPAQFVIVAGKSSCRGYRGLRRLVALFPISPARYVV